MENSNTPLSNEESLVIIQRMVREAQGAIAENGFDYIFWGWLLVAVSIAHYILLVTNSSIQPGLVYMLLPLGGVYSWLHHRREDKHERVKTHIDSLMGYIWGGFGATLFLILFMSSGSEASPMPFVLLLTGMATFISGGALKYKPLIFGGVSFWVFGAVSYFLPLEGQIAAQAVSMFVGYLIPGYMLLKQSRTANVQRA
ncbi:MAG TPA: hypothetical protein VFJ29_06305 [Candidatus Kapabacteria bacterium]|nr:hypothetical protein [Candidatus Kapabacteria bacterium]